MSSSKLLGSHFSTHPIAPKHTNKLIGVSDINNCSCPINIPIVPDIWNNQIKKMDIEIEESFKFVLF